jgi:hypothetical protein
MIKLKLDFYFNSSNTQILNEEQNTWIKNSSTKVYQVSEEDLFRI